MTKFIFKDWEDKIHTKTSKVSSCRYSYEYIGGVKKLVVRDFFTNKIVNRFSIPDCWICIRVEN